MGLCTMKNFKKKHCEYCSKQLIPHSSCYTKEWEDKRFCSSRCYGNARRNVGAQVTLDNGTKSCSKCLKFKIIKGNFQKSSAKPSGYSSQCLSCIKKARDARPKVVLPPAVRKGYELARYGLTYSIYEDMLVEQNYVCAICYQPERNIDKRTGKPRCLAVDHCHETGAVRGLLCHGCNVSLGYLSNKELLNSAQLYLENNGT